MVIRKTQWFSLMVIAFMTIVAIPIVFVLKPVELFFEDAPFYLNLPIFLYIWLMGFFLISQNRKWNIVIDSTSLRLESPKGEVYEELTLSKITKIYYDVESNTKFTGGDVRFVNYFYLVIEGDTVEDKYRFNRVSYKKSDLESLVDFIKSHNPQVRDSRNETKLL